MHLEITERQGRRQQSTDGTSQLSDTGRALPHVAYKGKDKTGNVCTHSITYWCIPVAIVEVETQQSILCYCTLSHKWHDFLG
jgi:hypothetical protein